MYKFGILLALLLAVAKTTNAQSTSAQDASTKNSATLNAQPLAIEKTTATGNNKQEPPRFSIFKPSFVMWSVPASRKDEQGLQIRLSAKYDFLTCSNTTEQGNLMSKGTCAIFNFESLQNALGTLSVFFSYTTDFDFYIISDGNKELERNSRPVRNRMNSPAFHLNWSSESSAIQSGFRYNSVSLSLVHHSNGQDLDFETLFTPASTDQEIRDTIANLAMNNPSWTDGVSRGWNYLGLSAKFDVGRDVLNCTSTIFCAQFTAGIKIPVFTDPANRIWWEPGNDSDYRDYNLGSIGFQNDFFAG